MAALRDVLEILGPRKDFAGRWIGHPRLNRLGLHPARIALSDALLRLRRRQAALMGRPPGVAQLERDGIVVIERFLPPGRFAAVRSEVWQRLSELAAHTPLPAASGRGFGQPQLFPGGFDRFDGGTLNRYAELDPERTPACHAAVRDPALARLCAVAAGFRHRPGRFFIYQTVHGSDEKKNPDIQKKLHKDTFHSTVKLWLFVDDVLDEHGPLVYVPGSHRMTWRRYQWEYQCARQAADPGSTAKGGAFRITEAEVQALGLPAPRRYPVAANTLIVADTRGFHCRGTAAAGAQRIGLYASLRKWPFSPVPY